MIEKNCNFLTVQMLSPEGILRLFGNLPKFKKVGIFEWIPPPPPPPNPHLDPPPDPIDRSSLQKDKLLQEIFPANILLRF